MYELNLAFPNICAEIFKSFLFGWLMGIEPMAQGTTILCSTYWAIATIKFYFLCGEGGNRTHIAGFSVQCLDQLGNLSLLLSWKDLNLQFPRSKRGDFASSSTGQWTHFLSFFKIFFKSFDFTLILIPSFLKFSWLELKVPSSTILIVSFFPIIYFLARRVWDLNPQDLLHVLLVFKTSSSSSQIPSEFLYQYVKEQKTPELVVRGLIS